MKKQEKIAKVYGGYLNACKPNENGWSNVNALDVGYETFDDDIEYCLPDHPLSLWRPIELKGIEDNNGWVKIESEADLPKENVDCFLCSQDGYIYCDRYFVNTKNFLSSHYKYATHYQPIEKPPLPIY